MISVLIVDDSATVRQTMRQILATASDIQVQDTAIDPLFALEKMKRHWPDVVLLDIEMPRMDGLAFLRKVMAEHPTPIIICSTLTQKGAAISMEALSAGAVAVFSKPELNVAAGLEGQAHELVRAVRAAAVAKPRVQVPRSSTSGLRQAPPAAGPPRSSASGLRQAPPTAGPPRSSASGLRQPPPTGAPRSSPSGLQPTPKPPMRSSPSGSLALSLQVPAKLSADAMLAKGPGPLAVTTERLVAIGTSTGGTQALEHILTRLSPTCPGIVIVQHMPAQFTSAFAARLDSLCRIEVKEAITGDRVLPGRALIAPGGKHLLAVRSGAMYAVEVRPGPPVNRHCPSVDVLFRSVARAAGRNATAFILTGMGDDGARGLLELHEAGAVTYAQDEASCVVFGMPKEAIALGAAQHICSLDEVHRLVEQAGRRQAA